MSLGMRLVCFPSFADVVYDTEITIAFVQAIRQLLK